MSQVNLKWNKRSQSFEAISDVSTREIETDATERIVRPELRNFNGQPLRISYFEQKGIFEYYDNDTKARGICGEMWTSICSFLNFTMVLKKNADPFIGHMTPDGNYTGILQSAVLNETDVVPHVEMFHRRFGAIEFSMGFWMQSGRIYSRGHWKQSPTWMFNIFTQDVWTAILGFLVILSLASIVTQRVLIRCKRRNMKSENILNHIFYNVSTLFNQPGSISENTGSGSKLLNVIIVSFSYLTLVAYNSRLIFSLAQESFAAPFYNVRSLMDETTYDIVILNGSVTQRIIDSDYADSFFRGKSESSRFKVVENEDELYSYVCENPDKYVFLHTDDEIAVKIGMKCDIEPVGHSYYSSPIASGFSHGFQHKKTIDYWLTRFREFGLLDEIRKRYMSAKREKPIVRQSKELSIGMDHVSVIFTILFSGFILSIIVCVVENIIFSMKKTKNRSISKRKK